MNANRLLWAVALLLTWALSACVADGDETSALPDPSASPQENPLAGLRGSWTGTWTFSTDPAQGQPAPDGGETGLTDALTVGFYDGRLSLSQLPCRRLVAEVLRQAAWSDCRLWTVDGADISGAGEYLMEAWPLGFSDNAAVYVLSTPDYDFYANLGRTAGERHMVGVRFAAGVNSTSHLLYMYPIVEGSLLVEALYVDQQLAVDYGDEPLELKFNLSLTH